MNKVFLVLGLACMSIPAAAHPPALPPQVAIDACARLADGDACSFTHESRALQGRCRVPPVADVLVCVPDSHPPRDSR